MRVLSSKPKPSPSAPRQHWQAAKERGIKLDRRHVDAELLRKDHREWPADMLTKAAEDRSKFSGTSLKTGPQEDYPACKSPQSSGSDAQTHVSV